MFWGVWRDLLLSAPYGGRLTMAMGNGLCGAIGIMGVIISAGAISGALGEALPGDGPFRRRATL